MLNSMKHITRLAIALMFVVPSASALAQDNALANPGFDNDLSGWDVFQDRVGEWSAEDADASGDSGSALLSNQGVSNGTVPLVLHQCVPVQAEVEYQFGADLQVPPDQPSGTLALIFVQSFASEDCSGAQSQIAEIAGDSVGNWESLANSITTGAGVMSARVGLGVFKQPGVSADAQAHYDNVFLQLPDPSAVSPAMSASWYNPDEAGHGIMIHLLNATDAWMCWFTFDSAGNPAWICALGTVDGDTITFDEAFTVEGGAFPPDFDPAQIDEVPWGSIVVVFTDCNSGMMNWTTQAAGFQSGEMPLARLTTLWGAVCN